MRQIQIDKTFFGTCAFTAILFILLTLPLSQSTFDGLVINTVSIFMIILPFIIPKSVLEWMVEKEYAE